MSNTLSIIISTTTFREFILLQLVSWFTMFQTWLESPLKMLQAGWFLQALYLVWSSCYIRLLFADFVRRLLGMREVIRHLEVVRQTLHGKKVTSQCFITDISFRYFYLYHVFFTTLFLFVSSSMVETRSAIRVADGMARHLSTWHHMHHRAVGTTTTPPTPRQTRLFTREGGRKESQPPFHLGGGLYNAQKKKTSPCWVLLLGFFSRKEIIVKYGC